VIEGDSVEFGFAAVLDQFIVNVPVISRHNLRFHLAGEHVHKFLPEDVGQDVLKEIDDKACDLQSWIFTIDREVLDVKVDSRNKFPKSDGKLLSIKTHFTVKLDIFHVRMKMASSNFQITGHVTNKIKINCDFLIWMMDF